MEDPVWIRNASIGIGLASALTMRVIQLPLTYISLVNHSPTRANAQVENASIDEKALAASSAQLVEPGDNLFQVLKKSIRVEGGIKILFLQKRLLPAVLGSLVQGAAMPLVGMLGNNLFERHKNRKGWFIFAAGLQSLMMQSFLLAVALPFDILEVRMRLQKVTRTTKEELKFLWLRLNFSEWFSSSVFGPALLGSAIPAASALVTQLVPSFVHANDAQVLQAQIFVSLLTSLGLGLLAFPVDRARQLACATLRPLEEPVIPVAEYAGLADELVRDEAWQGFGAAVQTRLLSLLPGPILGMLYASMRIQ
jgi:hypothetical protein